MRRGYKRRPSRPGCHGWVTGQPTRRNCSRSRGGSASLFGLVGRMSDPRCGRAFRPGLGGSSGWMRSLYSRTVSWPLLLSRESSTPGVSKTAVSETRIRCRLYATASRERRYPAVCPAPVFTRRQVRWPPATPRTWMCLPMRRPRPGAPAPALGLLWASRTDPNLSRDRRAAGTYTGLQAFRRSSAPRCRRRHLGWSLCSARWLSTCPRRSCI